MLAISQTQLGILEAARRVRFRAWLTGLLADRAAATEFPEPVDLDRLLLDAKVRGAETEADAVTIALLLAEIEVGGDLGPAQTAIRSLLDPIVTANGSQRLASIYALSPPELRARCFGIRPGA